MNIVTSVIKSGTCVNVNKLAMTATIAYYKATFGEDGSHLDRTEELQKSTEAELFQEVFNRNKEMRHVRGHFWQFVDYELQKKYKNFIVKKDIKEFYN